MPDRELTEEETRKLVQEHTSGAIFHALETFQKENTKPTLHDLCILELAAVAAATRKILIQQGRTLKALKLRVESLETGKK